MRPNPNFFHLRSSTTMTLNERFTRLNQKKPQSFTPPIKRGGIQKPRATNVRSLRGRLNQMSSNRLTSNNNNTGPNTSFRGSSFNRRGLRPGFNRGGRGGQNMNSISFNQSNFRGGFRGRGGINSRGRGGRRMSSPVKKTPEQKKEELDAELDAYMHAD